MDAKVRLYFQDENGMYSGLSTLMVDTWRRTFIVRGIRGGPHPVQCPLHASFKSRISRTSHHRLRQGQRRSAGQIPKVHYVDHVDESLPNESFGDGDHVNRPGAKVVTGQLARLVQLSH